MSDSFTYFFIGIDRGRKFHQVCVLDSDAQVVTQHTCQHLADPICQLAHWLPDQVYYQVEHLKIRLEIPNGSLVFALQSLVITLWSINPKQLSRFRDRC